MDFRNSQVTHGFANGSGFWWNRLQTLDKTA